MAHHANGSPRPEALWSRGFLLAAACLLSASSGRAADAWDPGDDTPGGATALSVTAAVLNHGPHTLDAVDTADWFSCGLTAGNTYQFDTIGGVGDDFGELYSDPAGTILVASDNDTGGGSQFKITFTPATTGTYYLRIRTFVAGASWSGTLHAQQTASGGGGGGGGFGSGGSSAMRFVPMASASALAQNLAGCGVTVLDVRYQGTRFSAGTFTGGTPYVGIDAGVVLSSGSISYNHQNSSESFGTDNALPGDADLEALTRTVAGGPTSQTFDATSLDIEFLTSATTVTVDFVFASDEYNEYANSAFNDIFAFFVNGKNIAVLPDGVTPISINNVNGGNPYGAGPVNQQYYLCNATGADACTLSVGSGWSATRFNGFELDGLTVVFTVTATLSGDPYHVNHMKIAVADMTDHIYDSAVFIRAGSFAAPGCIPPPPPPPPPPPGPGPIDPNVHGYPNPFRPGSGGAQDAAAMTFRSVPPGGRVRLYTLAGEFVVERNDAAGAGRVDWDGRNQAGKPVESGVYIVIASSADGRQRSRGRIVVIR